MKKEKEKRKENFPWVKVAIIGFSVLFVAMFVLSYLMTAGTLQYFKSVMANDSVTIDFTLRNADGQAILTSNPTVYQGVKNRGGLIFFTRNPPQLLAGHIGNPPVTGVSIDDTTTAFNEPQPEFALLGQELDELDAAVLGMRAGDSKTIHFMFSDPLAANLSSAEFNAIGGMFNSTSVGNWLCCLGFSSVPLVQGLNGVNNTPSQYLYRPMEVIAKTNDSITLQHRFPTADITVKEFK